MCKIDMSGNKISCCSNCWFIACRYSNNPYALKYNGNAQEIIQYYEDDDFCVTGYESEDFVLRGDT